MFDEIITLVDLVPAKVAALIAIGAAYGMLKVKSQNIQTRLDELEQEGLTMDKVMRTRVDALAQELSSHKTDTTDRLARIETKLDILLQARTIGG